MKCSNKTTLPVIGFLLAGAVLLGACSSKTGGGKGDSGGSSGATRVIADKSLQPVLMELTDIYTRQASADLQVDFKLSFEIQPDAKGDSADVYLLANNGYADTSHSDSLRRVILAYAVPCIVVPDLNPALVTDLKSLRQTKTLIGIADPARDVLGRFDMEILKKNGLSEDLASRLTIIGPSALDLADAVARGEVDAALGWTVFPYWTGGSADVILLNGIEIPRVAAVSAWRAAAPVDSAKALKLMNFLQTEDALNCFRKFGYLTLDSDLESYAPVAQIGGMPED